MARVLLDLDKDFFYQIETDDADGQSLLGKPIVMNKTVWEVLSITNDSKLGKVAYCRKLGTVVEHLMMGSERARPSPTGGCGAH